MTSKLITLANLDRFKSKLDDAFETWETAFNTWKGTIDTWKNTANTDINNLKTDKQDKLTAGDNITISNTNVVSAENTIYELPIATTNTLGGIKPDGTTITVNENGVASASGGSGTSSWTFVGQAEGTNSISLASVSTFKELYIEVLDSTSENLGAYYSNIVIREALGSEPKAYSNACLVGVINDTITYTTVVVNISLNSVRLQAFLSNGGDLSSQAITKVWYR